MPLTIAEKIKNLGKIEGKRRMVLDAVMHNPKVTMKSLANKHGWGYQTATGYLSDIYELLEVPKELREKDKRPWLFKEYSEVYKGNYQTLSEDQPAPSEPKTEKPVAKISLKPREPELYSQEWFDRLSEEEIAEFVEKQEAVAPKKKKPEKPITYQEAFGIQQKEPEVVNLPEAIKPKIFVSPPAPRRRLPTWAIVIIIILLSPMICSVIYYVLFIIAAILDFVIVPIFK